MNFEFPVGFHEFHTNNLLNFQMNRWYSTGFLKYKELKDAAKRINNFDDAKKIFKDIAEKSIKKDDWLRGATYLRAAEFFSLGNDPEKSELYNACIKAYRKAYADEPIIYEKIPYEKGYLPVMRIMTKKNSKGWILIHGGYDSFIEEFYFFCESFVDAGYDIIMFEGPGQGGALNHYGMTLTHEWEKPVSKVLDYYNIEDVTLIGISLGGYLASRAAAYEKRISRLVMYDIIYDFYRAVMYKASKALHLIIELSLPFENSIVWRLIEKKISTNLFAQWLVLQGYHIYGINTIAQYYKCMKKYNTRKISKLITQDTLLLAGEEDIYTVFFEKQKKALVNAKSVTGRIFTKDENASHHCQVGNIKLVLDYILEWIKKGDKYVDS